MFNFKDLLVSMTEVQASATVATIDAFSKFTGTETNTYVEQSKKFVESAKENAQKAIKGDYFFSGSKKKSEKFHAYH
jgi:hypothetical protein